MLLLLFKWLSGFGWKVPAAFFYFSTRMMLSAAIALLLTVFLGGKFIKKLYEMKIGQTIRSAKEVPLLAELHGKKKDTPTMGGVLMLSAMIIALFFCMDLSCSFTWVLLVATVAFGVLGGRDDYLKLKKRSSDGLKGKKKLAVQLGVSALFAGYVLMAPDGNAVSMDQGKPQVAMPQKEYVKQLYVPFVKEPVMKMPVWLAFLFFVLVVTGSSNAVNLTDGLDGLAAGCLVMVALVLGCFAFLSNNMELSRYLNLLYIEGSGEIAIYLFAMAGAGLGFLWYNGYPAQVFMGDTGSLAMGGVLGVASVLLCREGILAIAGAIFVAEALSVILQVLSFRYRNKKRIFLCAPIHHHFEYKGWPETKVVLRFWIVSLLFAVFAIASIKLQ